MKISACWIVKNEAANIAASIKSVRDCADEIIVVDTGSTDDTVRIATECGARVERFEWIYDFSAARNHTLSLAAGEYVIFIDADEYFDPALQKADRDVIIDSFEKTKADVLLIQRSEMAADTGLVMETTPHVRILRRAAIRYEYRIHEIAKLKTGALPRSSVLNEYRLTHMWYSAERNHEKLLRNIDILETEQRSLRDEFNLFNNKAYLTREYVALNDYEKAFLNCRYLLDHHTQWNTLCKTFLFSDIQRLYAAIGLATLCRFRFSRKEVYDKLFTAIKENYPGSREAALADLHYQLVFDYREDRFLRELAITETRTEKMPPAAIFESKQVEATLYARAALAAYYRGDAEKARRWAETALRTVPKSNVETMRAFLDGKPFDAAYAKIRDAILRGEYQNAYDQIIRDLDDGSLDHTLLEFLLVIAEKGSDELAFSARKRFDTGMSLLNEAIDLNDMVNTGYAGAEDVKKQTRVIRNVTADLFSKSYEEHKHRPVTPDILSLHGLAAPVYEESGLPLKAMHSYILLLAKEIEPQKNLRALTRLFRAHRNGKLVEHLEYFFA